MGWHNGSRSRNLPEKDQLGGWLNQGGDLRPHYHDKSQIVMLGEWHPESGLVPQPGETDRADFLFWLFYMASVGYPTFSRAWHPEQFVQQESAHESIRKTADANLNVLFGVLDGVIEGRSTFLRRGFSALDIYLAMIACWHPDRDALFRKFTKIASVCEAIEKRPACRAVMEDHFG